MHVSPAAYLDQMGARERHINEEQMQVHPKDSLDGKVGAILSSCEHMQVMQETIRTHVQPRSSKGMMSEGRREELKTKFRTQSSFVGKKALIVKKWQNYDGKSNEEECVNDNNQDLCEECRHSVRDHARWICRDCKTFLCDSCKMNLCDQNDRNKHRTTRLEQQSSSN